MQLLAGGLAHLAADVSILTRPEGRVQPLDNAEAIIRLPVSILTRPEGRVQHDVVHRGKLLSLFQSSPGLLAGCNRYDLRPDADPASVSILTRPGGRVQPAWLEETELTAPVSILTRPEGRVQPCRETTVSPRSTRFQSSPGQKAGCNPDWETRRRVRCAGFNPHPARRPGATSWCRWSAT